MGRLSGFSYRQVITKPKKVGFEFDRNAKGSHEIWWNPVNRKRTTIPNHPKDLAEGTLNAILKQAGISTDEFLKL